jgi:hypothetical protein
MICHIYPITANAGVYQWKWRGADGKQTSSRAFEHFYDCVEDARSHGAAIDLARIHRDIAAETLNVKIVADSERAVAKAAKREA